MNPPAEAPRVSRGPGWYLKRLSVMGPRELAHRALEQWTLQRLRSGHGRPRPPLPGTLNFCTADHARLPELPWDESGLAQDRQPRLLEGHWPALGFDWHWSSTGNPWHTAPDTGKAWPGDFFGTIPHRAGNPVGDVRVMWEPARLQQLVSLALLARHAGEPEAARAVGLLEEQLLSFSAANPPWAGVHYISAMECALRLVAVCHAVDMTRGRLQRRAEVMAATAALVDGHASLIIRRLSLYSSAGNHTVAECAGLVYAGTLFPELPDARRWQARGLRLLTSEFRRQVLDDGGSLEQAPWYLLLITDLAGLVVALLDHHHLDVPEELRQRLELARRHLGALARNPGELPALGDRDDGFALSPALRLSFADRDPAAVQTFVHTGLTLVRMPGSGTEICFDHGPLGMAPSYGHGHADALSVSLRRHGRGVLLDPGTYTYTGDPAWRAYFRSTAAHNTVRVDGLDQAVQETAFMWSRPYRCELVRAEEGPAGFMALARHDGFSGNSVKILHWRGLMVNSAGGLLVWDYLDGSGTHHVELRWHVGGTAIRSGGAWALDDDLVLAVTGGNGTVALEGSTDPAGGWQSGRYGSRKPAVTICAHHNGALPCEFLSLVHPQGAMPAEEELTAQLEKFRAWARQP